MNIQEFKKAKIKLTSRRAAIFTLLERMKQPASAEEIFRRLHHNKFTCDLATVYRTLETLYKKHLVNKIITPQFPMAKFEVVSKDHHHFTCTICKTVFDVPRCYLQPIMKDLEAKRHLLVTGHTLEFSGICQDCQ